MNQTELFQTLVIKFVQKQGKEIYHSRHRLIDTGIEYTFFKTLRFNKYICYNIM